jgi:hypothetical protein
MCIFIDTLAEQKTRKIYLKMLSVVISDVVKLWLTIIVFFTVGMYFLRVSISATHLRLTEVFLISNPGFPFVLMASFGREGKKDKHIIL